MFLEYNSASPIDKRLTAMLLFSSEKKFSKIRFHFSERRPAKAPRLGTHMFVSASVPHFHLKGREFSG